MALGTQQVGKLLDYEQYIEHQIQRTRARIKTTDVLTACLILATAGLGLLFVEVVARPHPRVAVVRAADRAL